MFLITCKCGDTTMAFRNLTADSFPNGWETDCCIEYKPQLKQKPTKKLEENLEQAEIVENLPEENSELRAKLMDLEVQPKPEPKAKKCKARKPKNG